MTEEIIARLRSLDLSDGGSHSRLSAIASCFLEPAYGWTRGACETLRDMLIDTLEDKDGNDNNDNSDGCNCTHHRCDQHGRQVSYDELGNERRKAIAELREIQTDAGGFVKALAGAIGVEWRAPKVAQTIATIRDRLVHLLGGDEQGSQMTPKAEEPSVESVSGMTKNAEIGELDGNGTCPDDGPTSSITDELREFKGHINAGLAPETALVLRAEVNCIADRIDEQFDRICQQQEKVLQDTIDYMCEEQGRLQERLRTAELGCDANHRLAKANARWCDELVDLLRDAAKEYKTLDQALAETSANFHAMRDRVWGLEAERDELQAKLDDYDKTHAELPKDANGEQVSIGDMVHDSEEGYDFRVDGFKLWGNTTEWWAFQDQAVQQKLERCSIVKPLTVEQVIRDLTLGKITEAQAIERIEGIHG